MRACLLPLLLAAAVHCGKFDESPPQAPGVDAAFPSPGACAGASAIPQIVSAANLVTSMASDGTTLYWADNAGTLHSVPASGGASTTLATDSAITNDFPTVGLMGGEVFVVGGQDVDRLDTASQQLVVLASQSSLVGGMTVGGGNIYWTYQLELGSRSPTSGSLNRIASGGGAVTTLEANLDNPGQVVVDETSAYWVDALGSISTAPLAGGAITTLVSNQQGVNGLAVAGGFVYWTNQVSTGSTCGVCPPPPAPTLGDGTLNRVPIGGGATTVLAQSYGAGGVALDETYAYWTDGKTISAVPLAGGTGRVLANEGAWVGPVVDSCYVYWVDTANTEIKRVARQQ